MTAQATQVLEGALHLSPLERAELIEQIFASFSFPSRQANDAEWAREAEDRIDAFDAGRLASTSAREIFARIEGMPQ
jgi:putative addiction module component (TIGR02574 family)